jgi:signal transduction histidine kinase
VHDDQVVARLGAAAARIGSGLELSEVLQHVVEAAAALLDARYAALGVIGEGDTLAEFVHTGVDDADRIGHLPKGLGILGLLIRDARPLRLEDLTTHPQAVGFPPGHPQMRSFLGVPIRVRDRVYGNLYITEKRGSDAFTEADEQLALALAGAAGAAVDNAFMYAATRRRERSLDALREISGQLLSGTAGDTVLDLITDRARELVSGEVAVLCVPTGGDDGDLVVRAASGADAALLHGASVPADTSLAGRVMRTGERTVTHDAPPELRSALGETTSGTVVGVPLLVRGAPFGVLAVAASALDDDELRLVETFANHASVMVEYGRARAELERLLVIEERERIGRDLHDTVIQQLFATGLHLQALAGRRQREDPELAGLLGGVVDGLDGIISQIRATIFALQPPALVGERDAVPAARLQQLVAGVVSEASRALGFEPDLVVPTREDVDIPADVAAHLLVVVREALSNVARHAAATEAEVTVELGMEVVARVSDNGIGMPASTPPGGRGLENLRHRAETLGGELMVAPDLEGGTVLEWRVGPVAEG